jgi:D-sedoheptulose 7-phosphate isomerase
MSFDQTFIASRIEQSSRAVAALAKQAAVIERIGRAVRDCFVRGGFVYTCGNGGSAAEAMHLSEELIGKYKHARRPYPAVCLNADPTAITCIANDYGYEQVFARQIEALGRKGDVLVGFSTSGESPNVLRAFEAARQHGVVTIGMLGKTGGKCAAVSDLALVVDHQATEIIQECHQVVLHLVLEAVEEGARG